MNRTSCMSVVLRIPIPTFYDWRATDLQLEWDKILDMPNLNFKNRLHCILSRALHFKM